jgi:hypothetical protein
MVGHLGCAPRSFLALTEGENMKKFHRVAACAVALVFAAGCWKHTYTVGNGGDINRNPKYSQWHGHYLWGLIGEENVDVKSICPSGNATIKEEHTFVNLLVSAVALGGLIYSPTTVEIFCEGGTASLVLPAETLQKIARNPRLMDYLEATNPEKAAELARALEASPPPAKIIAGR